MIESSNIENNLLKSDGYFLLNLLITLTCLQYVWFGIYPYVITNIIGNACVLLSGAYHLKLACVVQRKRQIAAKSQYKSWLESIYDITGIMSQQSPLEHCHVLLTVGYLTYRPLLCMWLVPTFAMTCVVELILTGILGCTLLVRWSNASACTDQNCSTPGMLHFLALCALRVTSQESLLHFFQLPMINSNTTTGCMIAAWTLTTIQRDWLQSGSGVCVYDSEDIHDFFPYHHCLSCLSVHGIYRYLTNIKNFILHRCKLTAELIHSTLGINKPRDKMYRYDFQNPLTDQQQQGINPTKYTLEQQQVQWENHKPIRLTDTTPGNFTLPLEFKEPGELKKVIDMKIMEHVNIAWGKVYNYRPTTRVQETVSLLKLSQSKAGSDDNQASNEQLGEMLYQKLEKYLERPTGATRISAQEYTANLEYINSMKTWIEDKIKEDEAKTNENIFKRQRLNENHSQKITKPQSATAVLKVKYDSSVWKKKITEKYSVLTLSDKSGYLARLTGVSLLFALAGQALKVMRMLCLNAVRAQAALQPGIALGLTNALFLTLALIGLYAFTRAVQYAAQASTYDFFVTPLQQPMNSFSLKHSVTNQLSYLEQRSRQFSHVLSRSINAFLTPK